jgi:hypothetical protein
LSRLTGRDELRLRSYYQAVDCYGSSTLLSSSWGIMVDAMMAGKIGSKTYATSDDAHSQQIALIPLAREIGRTQDQLRAMPREHRRVLLIAYCSRQVDELVSMFGSVLAGPVLLTDTVLGWYRADVISKRCHPVRVASWLVRKLPRGKVVTSPLSEKVRKMSAEADLILERACESWETAGQKLRSGGQ